MEKVLHLFLFFCLLSEPGFPQSTICDTISWAEKVTLKWSDFKKQPDTISSFNAISSVGIGYKAQTIGDTLIITIYCNFYPCRSWTKSSSQNLLNHEQTHFDIAEYFKRLFVDKLVSSHFKRREWPYQLKSIYEKLNNNRDSLDFIYDQSTDFSRNVRIQKKWSIDIRYRIERLKIADKPKIAIIIED